MDWDDLRYVLAIARGGSLAAAGRALGVNASTVHRRLDGLEARLAVRLFDRTPSGFHPTGAGERMIDAADRVEHEIIAVDRDLTGRDTRLSGRLRITSSETLAYRLLTDELASFRRHHPGIHLELLLDNRQFDLSRREADIALRATRPTQGELFGRKIADIVWALYGSADYLAGHDNEGGGDGDPLRGHDLIGWEQAVTQVKVAGWLAANAAENAVVYRSSSIINQLVAVKAGIGLAVLPCYLGDPEPDLRRAGPIIDDVTTELWVITHKALKQTARVRAFLDLVGEGLSRRRTLLEGRQAAAQAPSSTVG